MRACTEMMEDLVATTEEAAGKQANKGHTTH
jgi:hypothetical protein